MTAKRLIADVNAPRALLFLGNLQDKPTKVINDYIDNGIDARADDIWIVLAADDTVSVIDNGRGMVENMDPGDAEKLERFKTRAHAGLLEVGETVLDHISLRSKCSIEYMMQNIAFSAKTPDDEEIIRGEKGIGCLSYLQIARDIVYYTMPGVSLTNNQPLHPYELRPPNKDQLLRFNMEYTVVRSKRRLETPYGAKLESGTHVVISNLEPGVQVKLRPELLARSIQEKYGRAVQAGCRIVVIDRVTQEGRRSRGGKEIVIKPSSYVGVPIFKESRGLKGGRGSFMIELYYDADGKSNKVDLYRHQNYVRSLIDVPGLNIPPFNSGMLSGYVDFPHVAGDVLTWSTVKEIPNETAIKEQWVNILYDVAQVVQQKIGEIAQRQTNVAIMKIANMFERLTVEAMSDDEFFAGSFLKTTHHKAPTGAKRGIRDTVPHRKTEGVVKNEHSSPVENVVLALHKFKSPTELGPRITHYFTGKSGVLSFGELPYGQYVMRIDEDYMPPGHRRRSENNFPFRISEENPRQRVVFIVENGQPPTSDRRMRRINIYPHAFADPGVPYSLEKMQEPTWQLQINTEFTPYREAIDNADELRQTVLFADMVACGVAQHCLSDMELEQVMLGRLRLFSKYMEMLGISDNRKKARK